MWAFLQTYGIWLLFGVLILLMMRMHSGGRDMDHVQYEEYADRQRVEPMRVSNTDTKRAVPLEGKNTQHGTLVRDVSAEEGNVDEGRYQTSRRRGGC